MQFTAVSLAIVIGTIVLATTGSSEADDGLHCWVCNSTMKNDKCHDDFIETETETIQKLDCSKVPMPVSKTETGERNTPATYCSKTVYIVGGVTTFTSRSCASPGELGLTHGFTLDQCKTNTNDHGSTTRCICDSDYCNGSETLESGTIRTLFPLGLLFLVNWF